MTRFVLAIAAVALATPASGFAAPAAYASIELVGPAECCCTPEAEEDGSARLQARCCCEFTPARRGVAGYDAATGAASSPEPAATAIAMRPIEGPLAAIARRPVAAARAPPPGGVPLYAQHTSHLL